jgi:tetratricopeptide (TPR) repeat protein
MKRHGFFLALLLAGLILITIVGLTPRLQPADQGLQPTQEAAFRLASQAGLFPWPSELWLRAGQAALQAGDNTSAIYFLQQSLASCKNKRGGQPTPACKLRAPAVLTLLGDVYRLDGNLPATVQHWQAALELLSPADLAQTPGAIQPHPVDPLVPVLLHRLAKAQRLNGDYLAASQALKRLAQLQPDDATLLYELGLLLAATQPEAAPVYLLQAAELDAGLSRSVQPLLHSIQASLSENEPAYTLVSAGRALANLGEWELAQAAFQGAITLRPDYAEAWAFLGYARQTLAGAGTTSTGLPELQKAYTLDPLSVSANTLLALYWRQHERSDLALRYLQNAAALDVSNPALRVDIGEILAVLGDLEVARAQYQQATDMAPADPTYWRLLADFSLHYNLDIRQLALPAARQAVLLAPNDAASLDTMGRVYIRLNDLASARRLLRHALQSDPGYAPAYLDYGVVCLLQGDDSSALVYLSLARNLATDSATAEQAQRLLGGSK